MFVCGFCSGCYKYGGRHYSVYIILLFVVVVLLLFIHLLLFVGLLFGMIYFII